jgi:pimeloyl-ACP methyl ester carboxylesterase
MLHGYSDSWFSFSEVLPLMPSSFRVIAPSQRGHGDSDRPQHGYAVDDLAADAVQLLDALHINDAIVVGHSMGSLVARRMAERAPRRVKRLILVGTTTTIRNAGVIELGKEVDRLTDPVDETFVRAFQLSTIHRPIADAFLTRAIDESRKMPARVWKALFAGMWDNPPSTATVTRPTLVLAGAKDSVFSIEEQRAVVQAIPGAVFRLLPDIGHAVHWEDPRALVAVFERMLASQAEPW